MPGDGGHRIDLPGPDGRIHVYGPENWGNQLGTDYWANFHNADQIAGGGDDLVAHGWEASGFSFLAPSGADFLSGDPIADAGTTGGFNFDAANDFLISPFVFGAFAHAKAFEAIMGYLPTALHLEVFARFAANPDENASGFGWLEAGGGGGSPADADMMAFIGPGATQFELIRGDGTIDAGLEVKDTDPHLWKILCAGTTAEWFIDGVRQGSISLQTNLWPVAFVINTESTGTADPVASWAHIWYE